jgi:hypothetical protein
MDHEEEPMMCRSTYVGLRQVWPVWEAGMAARLQILAFSLIVLAASAAAVGDARAAEEKHLGTPEQQRACRPDVLRLCHDTSGGDIAIANCLLDHKEKLTPACREVITGSRK